MSGGVDQPLHIIVALRPPGAAIGGHLGGIGEYAFGCDFHQRRPVHPLQVLHTVERAEQRTELAQEGAHIGKVRDPHREEIALGIERQFSDDFIGAAMPVRYEAARSLVGPFHRTAKRACGVQEADIFGKDHGLHPE